MAPSEQVSSDYLGGKALTEEPWNKNHGVSEQNKDVPHKQKGQIQEENKLQKTQISEAGKKSKAQQLREKEIINTNNDMCGQRKPIYKALFKNRYWILIAKVENMVTSPSFFSNLEYKARSMRLGVFLPQKFHTCKQRN